MRVLSRAALAVLPLLLSSCYEASEGFHYLGLLAKGRTAAAVLADPAASEAAKRLLRRAAAIEAFGTGSLGEKPTKNFRKLVEIEGGTLANVVQACSALSFDRYLWSYPFVGKLPYRGYFDPADARKEAARLKALGLDVIVRGVDAFSTLGWLPDPLWSFMEDYGEAELAGLILHELMHATAFRKGADDWNEGVATFVGREGALAWMRSAYGPDSPELAAAVDARRDAEAYAAYLRGTAQELEALYSSAVDDGEKRKGKAAIIAARAEAFARDYGRLFRTEIYRKAPMAEVNNAWLDLYRLYEGEPALYRDWYERVSGSDLARFVREMAELARSRDDPLEAMRRRLASP